jgi:type I restriction enzyme R subunit
MSLGSESSTVQNPFILYAIEGEWTYPSPEETLSLRRGGVTSSVLDAVLPDQLLRLNPGVMDHRRAEITHCVKPLA